MLNAIKMLNAQCYLHLSGSRLVEIQRMKDYLFKKHDLLWCNETILPLCNFQSEIDFQPYTVKLTSHIVFFIFFPAQVPRVSRRLGEWAGWQNIIDIIDKMQNLRIHQDFWQWHL